MTSELEPTATVDLDELERLYGAADFETFDPGAENFIDRITSIFSALLTLARLGQEAEKIKAERDGLQRRLLARIDAFEEAHRSDVRRAAELGLESIREALIRAETAEREMDEAKAVELVLRANWLAEAGRADTARDNLAEAIARAEAAEARVSTLQAENEKLRAALHQARFCDLDPQTIALVDAALGRTP